MSDSEDCGKTYGLDMPKEEAVKRIAKITKEHASDQEVPVDLIEDGELQIALFKGKEVRQVFHNNEWHFSIVDVIGAVTETDRPRQYWVDLKRQLSEDEGYSELYENIVQLKMLSRDGKKYATDAVNVETLFRIVLSIPSSRAEPFKKWLAKVGYERIQEIQNPEIGIKRSILQWQIAGRDDDWINARIRSIATRVELTDEWKKRGVKVGPQYAQLTNIISRKTFGVDTAAHKKLKGLKNHNLRDHMTDLELIFTMLGEKSTTAIALTTNAQGFSQNAAAAASGGKIAGTAARELEKKTGKSITSKTNFLPDAASANAPTQLNLGKKKK